jgi:hypothetical protein
MLSLSGRIRSRNQRSRLDQSKLPLVKKPPTLSGSQRHPVCPLDVGCQSLAVPQIAAQAEIAWSLSQCGLNLRYLLRIQPAGTPRTRSLLQSSQALLLEAAHPIFNGSRSVTQQFGNVAAIHSLRDKQYAVQAVVIAGFRISSNLVLQTKNDYQRFRNRQRFHAYMKAHSTNIRNYL